MSFLSQIQHENFALCLDWKLVQYIVSIEKLNVTWREVERKERTFLEATKAPSREISRCLKHSDIGTLIQKKNACDVEGGVLSAFEEAIFWYETEIEIPVPIRCAILIYYFRVDERLRCLDQRINLKVVGILLFQSGYTWVRWLDLASLRKVCRHIDNFKSTRTEPVNRKIYDWLLFFLMVILDVQEMQNARVLKYSIYENLILKEKLLIHIIQHNAGIKTRQIARKLGTCEMTVRRMLTKLRRDKLINTYGAGSATSHVVC